ncbi:PII-like signaling protein [Rhodanobacter sp. TND4EL1]
MNQDNLQQGVHLTFYCHSRARHDGMLLSEWLLEQAKKRGLGGGSVFRAISGFGRHGVLHEEQFFELADDLPVKIEFLLRDAQAESLLQLVRDAAVDATCACWPASFEILHKQ